MSVPAWLSKELSKLLNSVAEHFAALIATLLGAGALLAWPYVFGTAILAHDYLAVLPFEAWGAMFALLLATLLALYQQRSILRAALKAHEFEFQPFGGVKWKVFPYARYVEGSPYCTCCDVPRVLSRGHILGGDETLLTCPVSNRQFHIVNNGVARRVDESWEAISKSWFRNLGQIIQEEMERQHMLHPEESTKQVLSRALQEPPQNRIPRLVMWKLRQQLKGDPLMLVAYLDRHQRRYWKYMVRPKP